MTDPVRALQQQQQQQHQRQPSVIAARLLFRLASTGPERFRPRLSWLLRGVPLGRPGTPWHGTRAAARASGLWAGGRRAEARDVAERAGTAGGLGTRLAMAELLLRMDAPRRALTLVRGAGISRHHRTGRAFLLLRARAAADCGRYAEAIAALDAMTHRVPTDSDALALIRRVRSLEARFEATPAISRFASPARAAPLPGRSLLIVQESLLDVQSGYTIRTRDVVAAQRLRGLDPHVFVSRPPGRRPALGKHQNVEGTPFRWLPDGEGGELAHAELAAEAAERLAPSVIHPATPFRLGRLGIDIARWLGIPAVYEVRGFREETWLATHGETCDADQYLLTRRSDTEVMLAADAVVTLGEQMKQDLVTRGVDGARIWVIPNAVDAVRFNPAPRDPAKAARYGIERTDVVVGYISSFESYEDFDSLVDGIGLLRGRGHPVRGLLVGDGPIHAQVTRRVHRAGLDGVVLLPGRVPNTAVHRYHQLIDVFVVPRVDARVSALVTPLKPMEAMATGRALVVSRLPALLEAIEEGITGVSFAPGDARDLADVVEPLVGDPVARGRLGEAARAWILAERTLERSGDRYRELYERLGVELSPPA